MGIGDKFKNIFSKGNSGKTISFKRLSELIDGKTEISLDSDVVFKRNDSRIKIYNDELTIEGNGHVIDAKNKTGMFEIKYDRQLTIKNVVFKNTSEAAIEQYHDTLLQLINCTFENCNSRNGGAVYSNNGNLKAKNCIFKDNTSTMETPYPYEVGKGGGAIYGASCDTNLKNCIFEGNSSKTHGGAISTEYGRVILNECVFKNNTAKTGGIVYNFESEIEMTNCQIVSNSAETEHGIYCDKGIIKMITCEITDNENIDYMFFNKDFLELHYCTFKNNTSRQLIVNKRQATLSIMHGGFKDNTSQENMIHNFGKFCIIEKTLFKNNNVTDNSTGIIYNGTNMTLVRPKFNDAGKMITTDREIILKSSPDDLKDKIEGQGDIIIDDGSQTFSQNDFHNLDKKIHEADGKEIVLDEDVTFEAYEKDYYEGGIELDIDNLTIDGNGKTIDGNGLSRIFIITGKNITLKNITFKNGMSHRNPNNSINGNGGILRIHTEGHVKIENCKFTDSKSEETSGAIYNKGELMLIESEISNNTASNCAAIYSTGKLEINSCTISNNKATLIGAVFNFNGEIKIENSAFEWNKGENDVGALASAGDLKMSDCTFTRNSSKNYMGGALRSDDTGHLERCSFKNNAAGSGGAIYNSGEMELIDCEFKANHTKFNSVCVDERNISAGALHNDGELKASGCIFDNNSTSGDGGAVYGRKRMELEECTFINNHAKENLGGAIFYSGVLNIANCNLNNNESKEGGAIYYSTSNYEDKNELNVIKSNLSENSAEKGGAILLSPHRSGMPICIEECDFSSNNPDDVFEE